MMTQTITTYKYEELDRVAQVRASQWYEMKALDPLFFREYCEEYLKNLFPNSDLTVAFSLSYSKGDGLLVYGSLDLRDCLTVVHDKFTPTEIKFLNWVITEWEDTYKIPYSNYYHLFLDFAGEIVGDMEWNNIRGIKEDVLIKFEKEIEEYLLDLCNQLEKDGYKFFYEYSEEDVTQYYEERGYYFLLDGTLVQDWWTE